MCVDTDGTGGRMRAAQRREGDGATADDMRSHADDHLRGIAAATVAGALGGALVGVASRPW